MADNQVQQQDVANAAPAQQGCGCGNTQKPAASAMLNRIKQRQDKIYKTKSKVF